MTLPRSASQTRSAPRSCQVAISEPVWCPVADLPYPSRRRTAPVCASHNHTELAIASLVATVVPSALHAAVQMLDRWPSRRSSAPVDGSQIAIARPELPPHTSRRPSGLHARHPVPSHARCARCAPLASQTSTSLLRPPAASAVPSGLHASVYFSSSVSALHSRVPAALHTTSSSLVVPAMRSPCHAID